MAFQVNSVLVTVTNNKARLTANVKIDAFLAQNFDAQINIGATGKKAKLGQMIKEKVLKEQTRLNTETSAQNVISATDLQTFLNA